MDRTFIIYELVKSAQVCGHLLRNLRDDQMGLFICKANILLEWKIDLLQEAGFWNDARIGETALRSLQEKRGQWFRLRSHLSAWEFGCMELANFEDVERQLAKDPLGAWQLLEVWERKDGQSLRTWSFYMEMGKPVYFCHWEAVSKGNTESLIFAPNNMCTVDLPLPFQIGDLLKIDCTPFAPVKEALVLTEDLQILFPDGNGGIYVDTLSSGSVFGSDRWNIIPPLYGADLIKHDTQMTLTGIRDYIAGDAGKAKNILHWFRKYAKDRNRLSEVALLHLVERWAEFERTYCGIEKIF